MAQLVPPVTLALLTQPVDITSRTARLFFQISFGAGYYTVGGVPSGIAAAAEALGMNPSEYLFGVIQSQATTTTDGSSLPVAGNIIYKYIPSTDKIQMFTQSNGIEFTASEAIPHAVLFDSIVGCFEYNRMV